ncbi:MAG: DUF192 domain-containing protein [Candidatus Omnitrophota bacterium]|nr:DUF192 domain-containing protein [Candidatus Omnitrophota bacterium]
MIIKNVTRGTVLAEKVTFAYSFKSRFQGLIGRAALEKGEALALPSCNSIHTFFMRFAIDVLFLDSTGKVVGKIENMAPFRISPIFWQGSMVIELPIGTAQRTLTHISDTISWVG